MTDTPGLLVALGAGLLSFLSPCVLPLIPGYISFISGNEASEVRTGKKTRGAILLRTLFFVLGFTAVFTVLGIVFGGGAALLGGASRKITLAAGVLIILFGLNTLFDFLKFLNSERRAHPTERPRGLAGAFLVGMAFGAGWSPCVGPILASILLYAGRNGNPFAAGSLLFAYSLGLALPFLAAGAFLDRLKPLLDWFKRHGREVRIASGILLVLIGLGMALGKASALNGLLSRAGFELAAISHGNPGGARITMLAIYFFAGAIISLPPLLRRSPFARPWRIAALVLITAATAGEILGFWSGISILSGWLLFQGA